MRRAGSLGEGADTALVLSHLATSHALVVNSVSWDLITKTYLEALVKVKYSVHTLSGKNSTFLIANQSMYLSEDVIISRFLPSFLHGGYSCHDSLY